jgi:hypothetical protein
MAIGGGTIGPGVGVMPMGQMPNPMPGTLTPEQYQQQFVDYYSFPGIGVEAAPEVDDEEKKDEPVRPNILTPVGQRDESAPNIFRQVPIGTGPAYDISDVDPNDYIANFGKDRTTYTTDAGGFKEYLSRGAQAIKERNLEVPGVVSLTGLPIGALAYGAAELNRTQQKKNANAISQAGGNAGSMFTLNGQTVSRAPGSTRFDGTIVGMSNEQLYRLDEIRNRFIPGTMRENALAPEDGGGYLRTGKEALSSAGDVVIDAFGTVHGAGGPQMVGALQAERAREQMFLDAMQGRSLEGVNVSSAALAMKQALNAEMRGSKSFFTTTARMSDADYNKALTRSQQFIQNYVSKNYGSEEEAPAAPTIPETVIQAQEQAGGSQPSGGGDSGDDGGSIGGGRGEDSDRGGAGRTGGSGSGDVGGATGTDTSSFEGEAADFRLGGRVGMQAGGVAQQPQPAGFVGGPPENFTDGQTVADDQPMSVPEGTFVINAAAVEFAGSDDIKKMLSDAYGKMQKKVDKTISVAKIPTEDEIDVAVSRGEVIVPPAVAKIIGYDRLEKINNRGKKEVSRRQEKAGGGFLDGKKFADGGEVDYEDRIIANEVRRKMKEMLGSLPEDVAVTSEYYEDQPTAKMAGRLYEGKTVSEYHKALADATGMVPITGKFKANPRTQEINVPQTPTLFNLFAMAEEIAHLDYLDKRRTNPYPDPEALGSFFNPSAQMNKKYSQYDRKLGAKEAFNAYEAFEMEERYNEEMRAKAIAYDTVRGMLPKSKKTADFTKLGYQESFARYVYDNAPPAIRAGLFKKYPELQQFVDDKDRFVSKKTPIINEGVREYNRRARKVEAQRKK